MKWTCVVLSRVWVAGLLWLGLGAIRAEAQITAYVANENSNTVSVVSDNATPPTVVASVGVGNGPRGVAIAPDGSRVYVTNIWGGDVSVIDTTSNSVVATVTVGLWPGGVAVTPNGKRVYVANRASDSVSVIDTTSNSVVATVPVGVSPVGVAVTPNGSQAYVTNMASYSVSVIDTTTNSVVATVAVGVEPWGVAFAPTGKRAYVANIYPPYLVGSVSVIDTTTNPPTVVATVSGVNGPTGLAVTPDGKRVYAGSQWRGGASVIDTTTNSVVATVGFSYGCSYGIAITPDGRKAYVSDRCLGGVKVIDTTTDPPSLVTTFSVGSAPMEIAIRPELQVAIDIKPGSYPNSINLGSNGTVPVAILSSATFDATTVNPTTVTLAGASVAVKGNGTLNYSFQDVNLDGRTDIVVHVTTVALVLSPTDTVAVLTGETYTGQKIRGTDTIRVVP